jgi:3-oxoacyl-[acyl-carrier protein] reductase
LRDGTGVTVREILGDLDGPATCAELIAACPEAGILVNNNGGPI